MARARWSNQLFLTGWLLIVPWGVLAATRLPAADGPPAGVTLAPFDVDATPPVGAAMAYGPAVKAADLQLRCRGIVLSGAGDPIVLCAIDWIGVGNAAHDAFRVGLAEAAGTTPARVAVHALHQHDAPHADFTAEKLLAGMGVKDHPRFDGDFHRDLPPLNVATFRERISGGDAAPNLGPTELLAMQGRYLGMPR